MTAPHLTAFEASVVFLMLLIGVIDMAKLETALELRQRPRWLIYTVLVLATCVVVSVLTLTIGAFL